MKTYHFSHMSTMQRLKISELGKAARLIHRLIAGYRKYVVVFLVLGFLSGILEAVGISALIPLFSVFMGDSGIGDDFFSQTILAAFSFVGVTPTLPAILIFIVALFVLKAGVLLLFHYIQILLKTKYQEDLMNRLFKRTLYADWPYLMKQKQGDLETLLKIDVIHAAALLDLFVKIIMIMTGLVIYLLVALNISETITLLALGGGILISLVFKPVFTKGRFVARKTSEMNKRIAHLVNEHLGGVKVVKAMGLEKKVVGIGGSFFSVFRSLQIRTFMLKKLVVVFIQPITVIFVAAVVAFAYYQTSYSIGALAAIIYLIQRIFSSVQSSQTVLFNMNDSAPYAANVLRYSEEAVAHQEVQTEKNKEEKTFRFEHKLEFKDVRFSYETGAEIFNIDGLSIARGSMVGIIGPSGSGKTTLVDMLLRLFSPTKGSIMLDGVDIKDIEMASWRKSVGYVSQDIFMLNDTIANNIKFFDTDVTEKEILEAARMANMLDFITSLPQGFETHIGERGVRLSVGQRQRIAIARVLARKPKILVLDEATSSLDTESEKEIQETIEGLKGHITVIVVAHRLSTIMNSDELFVLKDGHIVESGSPEALLKKKESYFSHMLNNSERN